MSAVQRSQCRLHYGFDQVGTADDSSLTFQKVDTGKGGLGPSQRRFDTMAIRSFDEEEIYAAVAEPADEVIASAETRTSGERISEQ